MHFTERLRILIDQSADPPCLCAGEVVRDDASGRENDGIVAVRLLGSRFPLDGLEVGFAVWMIERIALVKPRGTWVVYRWTRPENSLCAIDAIPGDSVVIGNTAFRSYAQLVKDLFGGVVLELIRGAEASR